jgi:hypothetical protein
MDDGARLMVVQERANQVGVADVAADKLVAKVRVERGKVGRVAGVGQQVKIDD